MAWKVHHHPLRWGLLRTAAGRPTVYFAPDAFGRPEFVRKHSPVSVPRAKIAAGIERAKRRVGSQRGRFGLAKSEERRMFCAAVAEELNREEGLI